jgi:hypothetical protein
MSRFEVVGDVMGDYDEEIDGEDDEIEGASVVGYEDDGTPIVVGARKRKKRRSAVLVKKPSWRRSTLAPGVIAPDQGLLPLPLNGAGGTNTFTATVPSITFQGQLQKPFRGERLLVSVVRTGTSTDLQQLDVGGFDIEQVGNPQAFGVRLTMKPSQPGVFTRLVVTLNAPLTGTDTIATTVTVLGRLVH